MEKNRLIAIGILKKGEGTTKKKLLRPPVGGKQEGANMEIFA